MNDRKGSIGRESRFPAHLGGIRDRTLGLRLAREMSEFLQAVMEEICGIGHEGFIRDYTELHLPA